MEEFMTRDKSVLQVDKLKQELLEALQLLDGLIVYTGLDASDADYERKYIQALCKKYEWVL